MERNTTVSGTVGLLAGAALTTLINSGESAQVTPQPEKETIAVVEIIETKDGQIEKTSEEFIEFYFTAKEGGLVYQDTIRKKKDEDTTKVNDEFNGKFEKWKKYIKNPK